MKVHILVLLFGFLQSSQALVNIENPLLDQIIDRKVKELVSEALKEYKEKINRLEDQVLKQETRIRDLENGGKAKEDGFIALQTSGRPQTRNCSENG
jgi:hypothetical protein